MLVLQAISGPRDSQALLDQFDPGANTWVVSDLKTKLDLQRQLMANREFLAGDAVLRASELWRVLLTRLRPDIQIVSKEFIVTLIAQELSDRSEPWTQSPGAAQTAYQYLCQLMPILSHPQGAEIMTEWFSTHEPSRVRWGRWFDLCVELWAAMLKRGVVAGPWVSGVLVNELEFEKIWDRKLIFDLGAELNQVEADLIALLANHVPVTVLQPRPVWRDEYGRTLLAYDILEKKPKITTQFFSTGDSDTRRIGTREFAKFTTMLAEVKHAVARSRQWLDGASDTVSDGALSDTTADTISNTKLEPVPPPQIAIVAPDIETYWPALSAYLDQEGIPCQKPLVARLHAFPDISQWLATLRLKAGGHNEADLEVSLFESALRPSMPYERFKVLYSAIYSREDLQRSEEVARLFSIELKETDEVDRDSFVAWSLKGLPESADRARVESVFKRLFQECSEITRLSVHRWLTYFEELAGKTETVISPGQANGIACINLVSAENSSATHMIMMGLTESAMKQGAETGILFSDILSLASSYGFHLQAPDLAKLEFEARWVVENTSRHLILSVPETDFDGGVQAAAWLWVKGAREAGVVTDVQVPGHTRWDEIQRSSFAWLANDRKWSAERAELTSNSLEEDLGMKPLPPYGGGLVKSLSASKIEDYLKCPFIFAAKHLFRLTDAPHLDLEVDPRTRGSLVHALFELLTRQPMYFEYSDSELEKIVEAARIQAVMQIYDERLWPSVRSRYMNVARQFLAFEQEWRRTFERTTTLDRELEIQGYVDPGTGDLVRNSFAEAIPFRGSIDRVDVDDKGHAAVIDYKPTDRAGQYSSWIKNDSLQLLLYSIALENGLTKHNVKEVVSAVYYAAKTMERDKGFKVDDIEQGLYSTDDSKRNKLGIEAKRRLFAEAKTSVQRALARMHGRDFAPVPKDTSICKDCRWSVLCRAPHLNT